MFPTIIDKFGVGADVLCYAPSYPIEAITHELTNSFHEATVSFHIIFQKKENDFFKQCHLLGPYFCCFLTGMSMRNTTCPNALNKYNFFFFKLFFSYLNPSFLEWSRHLIWAETEFYRYLQIQQSLHRTTDFQDISGRQCPNG